MTGTLPKIACTPPPDTSCSSWPQKPPGCTNGLDQHIDLVHGSIDIETRAAGPVDAQHLHQGHGTVMSGANGHTVVVQNRGLGPVASAPAHTAPGPVRGPVQLPSPAFAG